MDFSSITAASDAVKQQLNDAGVQSTQPTPSPVTTPTPASTTPVVSNTQPTPTPTTTTTPVTPDPAATPAAISPADQKLFEINLGNGRVEKLTEDQVKSNYFDGLRQADYTRKTQEVANQRKELETTASQLAQAQQQIFAARQQLVQQYQNSSYNQQQPSVPQTAQFDPSQPATLGQLQQFAQAMQQHMGQQQVNPQAIQQFAQRIVEDRLQVANYAEHINNTLGDIYKDSPVLKSVPEIEDILRFRVAQMQPESLEQTTKAFKDVAAEISMNLGSQFRQLQQQQVAQKAQLTSGGIEPPGGTAPQPTQQTFKTTNPGRLDWDKMKQAAISQING